MSECKKRKRKTIQETSDWIQISDYVLLIGNAVVYLVYDTDQYQLKIQPPKLDGKVHTVRSLTYGTLICCRKPFYTRDKRSSANLWC